ncbi:MAG: hypothetical protein KGJ68_06730 [Gammaproteobacteria bacterium]|nr:hypothetical protein [Gammaproteobacteria bacterium]
MRQAILRGFMVTGALRVALALGAALALGGCTGTDVNTGGTNPTNASATGIWSGTDSVTGLSVIGYVNSTGDAVFMRADGAQFAGPTQVSGESLVSAVIGYADFGNQFSDGSTYGLGTLEGTVTTGGTMTLMLSFTTNNGTAQSGSWSLSFNSLSGSGASLNAVSASYTDSGGVAAITIDGSGLMSGQDGNGCVLSGSLSVSDSSVDLYQVTFTFQSCTGNYAVLNGVEFTGLAALDTTTSPAQLTIAVSGANGTSKFALVLNLLVS